MAIKITNVFTRANTSIAWPGENYILSTNNLLPSRLNIDYTSSTTFSDDNLIRTIVNLWPNKEKYLEVSLSSSAVDTENWINSCMVEGLTSVRTIETV
jgi:hypothetical protein